jgi:hypothetical protein
MKFHVEPFTYFRHHVRAFNFSDSMLERLLQELN